MSFQLLGFRIAVRWLTPVVWSVERGSEVLRSQSPAGESDARTSKRLNRESLRLIRSEGHIMLQKRQVSRKPRTYAKDCRRATTVTVLAGPNTQSGISLIHVSEEKTGCSFLYAKECKIGSGSSQIDRRVAGLSLPDNAAKPPQDFRDIWSLRPILPPTLHQ